MFYNNKNEIANKMTWIWLRKGNLKRETESFNGCTKQLYQRKT